jgi:hypothetical protein
MFKLVRPTTVTVVLIFLLIFLFSRCINGSSFESTDVRGLEYAGSQTCVRCHKNISSSWSHTAHFRTSRLINELPANWFSQNAFVFNDSVRLTVSKNGSAILQAEYVNNKAALSKPFQLAIGSGDQAASFGYWNNGKVYQLPLTYFASIHGWANSPGFPSAEPYFFRPILIRCFECHASFAKDAAAQTGGLGSMGIDSSSIIYGIDCERCHGPAADHVRFHLQNPSEKQAKYIATWKSLSRQQKLDACAVCHSGNDRALQNSTFAFKFGDTLANYYFPFSNGSTESDVHGKQMQLLASSRCFQMSQTLECGTCHAMHQSSTGNVITMSASCTSCHRKGPHIDCPVASKLNSPLQNNCIDCHMPYLSSKKISIQGEAQQTRDYLLRTHRIAVYPEESKKVLLQKKM